MKFVAFMGAYMGIESSALGQVAKALENTPRLPVIWEHFQECTCCSESFIRSDHPIVADIILDKISLDYTLTLMAASGHQAEAAKQATMEKYKGKYILCVEGSIPLGDDGNYCVIGGRTAIDILKESAKDAAAIIAWGSCATTGCVQAAKPNPTNAVPINKIITDKPIINVPGCPPIGEVMAGVIVHVIAFGKLPELDSQGRPKAFYSKRVHDSCYRRPYFDAGLFVVVINALTTFRRLIARVFLAPFPVSESSVSIACSVSRSNVSRRFLIAAAPISPLKYMP